MDKKLFAGIVTYNPDMEYLKKNVEAIYLQVPLVVIVDNGSNNIECIKKLCRNIENIKIVPFETNRGIAAALNRLMQYGFDNGYTWMLSLDQDSECPPDYCKNAEPLLTILPNIGIVGPIIHDRKVGIVGHNPKGEYGIVNTCITSGAFTKISIWEEIGGYDEKMFIDSVDFEYCYRVRKAGYLVIQSKNIILNHSIGEGRIISIGPFKKKLMEHSAFRCYYIAQNNVYYPLKHHLWFRLVRGILRNIIMLFFVVLYEEDKKDKVKSVIKGAKMGLSML